MIRLLLDSLPESVRLVLWHALRERYALPNATTVTAANMVIEDNVEVTIAEPATN